METGRSEPIEGSKLGCNQPEIVANRRAFLLLQVLRMNNKRLKDTVR
jgi:hypothetical protein